MNQISVTYSPLAPPIPDGVNTRLLWGNLQGAAAALAIAQVAYQIKQYVLVITTDTAEATRLQAELQFFLHQISPDDSIIVFNFPDWETLPYDIFSPLPELVSKRLLTLHRLPQYTRGILVVPIATLLAKLPPRDYVDAYSFVLKRGERLDLDQLRTRLDRAGYRCVSQVITHGEFAVRGALLDLFPMGSKAPLRIDLFDNEIDSIRTFDPDTQRSKNKQEEIYLLPAREFPVTEEAIAGFRQRYRAAIDHDPKVSLIYNEVSAGRFPGGIEYYLPLFFDDTATLFDYLPATTLIIESSTIRSSAQKIIDTICSRYEQRRHDIERPLLPPSALYLTADQFAAHLNQLPGINWQTDSINERRKGYAAVYNFATAMPPSLVIQARNQAPAHALQSFMQTAQQRVLFVAESAGRRELLNEQLASFAIHPVNINSWLEFIHGNMPCALTIAPIEEPLLLPNEKLALITATQLYGERVRQPQQFARERDPDTIIRNLTELHSGAPVVHETHGIGRFLGLQTLTVGGIETEFLALEYAQNAKLYVPVSSLHLISRYTGGTAEQAPLHRLGSDQWERTKQKITKQINDVAAELLDLYARRSARQGHVFPDPGTDYVAFADAFAFEETPDQQRAIDAILRDMADQKPMDRVVCGDVGFGKTEVALRAAFVAVSGGCQVVVLVPTTLLAQQHYQNFLDRFADWPICIDSLSRFRSAKEQSQILNGLADGSIDIIIGTHKLLQPNVRFKHLGLIIVDEEHRFGVRHKEQLKHLRAEVDVLTLTATPIPRTLNMAMSGMRDLSIIATPPVARHPIKTVITSWNDILIQEACQRELQRGGQIYFLHNEVDTIEQTAQRVATLLPTARVQIAHGQMRTAELERVMQDFYHRRFGILICTTIIESGIDVPNANTILINRADKLGLAQLHQLRGRVGRSHHRAYAYLIVPPAATMTEDAKKRLEAIASLEELGAGFTLATHDLEIRGAGELLGDEQSGQIHEIGFSLYMELLQRAVMALKSGQSPELDRPLSHGTEIDLGIPALLPSDYLPDVHIRLVTYKRIASATDSKTLRVLKVEMIDRFGLLPEPAKNLFAVTKLKLCAQPLGIRKIEVGANGGRFLFDEQPSIDHKRLVQLIQTKPKLFKFDPARGALKFFAAITTAEQRVAMVEQIIQQLSAQ
ncbi:transcription-repair coupling factor [Thiospirillum jenense]|uniref:Transcription-repair-coupling factor n=1 Tax=Thiospirillum jenense TaxID=1653858 RepID=A0A839HCP8_9GAMM|nr:transcription-repair coupling factor [Thiospirillum jenense]MBB1126431.1 transcription-repair coupling factor [Thiospirillum jenense]